MFGAYYCGQSYPAQGGGLLIDPDWIGVVSVTMIGPTSLSAALAGPTARSVTLIGPTGLTAHIHP